MLAVFLLTNDLTPPTDEFHHQMQSQCTHDTPKPESRTLIIEKKRSTDRAYYANLTPEQRQAKIAKVNANKALRRNTPSQYSIAMENPGYVASSMSPRKHVTHGERQALLAHRNESFRIKNRTRSASLEDPSVSAEPANGIDSTNQPSVTNNGENPILKI